MAGVSSSEQVVQSPNSTFFTQEELNNLKSDYETGGLEKITPLIQRKVNELDSTELNIAVTGETGAGKSTFINAMRGLQGDDKGAAEVGNTETTMKPTSYPHPILPNVCFWDLPGIGSTTFPANKYLTEMKFERYDFFIIISDCRFRENDVQLAKEIKRLGKNFYFIRSKIDNDLDSMKKQRREFNEEEELEKIRSYCVRNLQKAGIPSPKVFLISSFDLNLYDFTLLSEALEDDLQNIKKSVFILALPNLNLEILEKKRKQLRKRIWMLATLSGAVGAVPVPGLSFACDIGILIAGIIHFRKCLGLDDASLQRLANKAGKPVGVLKAAVKTPLVGEITPELITRLQWGLAAVTISVIEFALDFIPVIGSIFGAGSSFLMTYKLLSDALDELTANAQRVAKAAFGTTIQDPNSTFFSQEEISNLKSAYKTGGLKAVVPLIQRKLDELDSTELNIAVTGESGAGKSTFINAIRGLQSDDEGRAIRDGQQMLALPATLTSHERIKEKAKTGTTETTMEPTPYPHPNLPNVVYWDLPGIGSTKFPANKYLRKMKFERFDFFFIISDCRFTEHDAKLAKEIKWLGKNFYFIRSKIDNDLNSMKKQQRNVNEEELGKIRNACVSKLHEAGIPSPKVFLISSFDLNLHDFTLLSEALEDDLPNIKESVFILALPNLTLEIVEKKRKELRKRVWMLATLSRTVGAVSVPGLSYACNIEILIGGIIHFRKCLGLDDASLQRLANKAGKPVEDLKAVVNSSLLGEITPELLIRLRSFLVAFAISVFEYILDFIPVIGSIFGRGSSFFMTYKLLSDALDDVAANAQRVVKAAFGTD